MEINESKFDPKYESDNGAKPAVGVNTQKNTGEGSSDSANRDGQNRRNGANGARRNRNRRQNGGQAGMQHNPQSQGGEGGTKPFKPQASVQANGQAGGSQESPQGRQNGNRPQGETRQDGGNGNSQHRQGGRPFKPQINGQANGSQGGPQDRQNGNRPQGEIRQGGGNAGSQRKQGGGHNNPQGRQNGAKREDSFTGVLAEPIRKLKLSEKTEMLLEKNGIMRIGELTSRTEKEMYRIQTFGKKNLLEIKSAFGKFRLSFTTDEERAQGIKPGAGGKADKGVNGKNGQPVFVTEPEPEPKSLLKIGFTAIEKKAAEEAKKEEQRKREKPKAPLAAPNWRKVSRGGKWGFSDGIKTVIPEMYDEVWDFSEGLACVEKDERCGFINEKNELVIPCVYDIAMSFSEGLAMVVKGGKCGYINKDDEKIVPFEFDAATKIEDGKARIKQDGRWGVLNISVNDGGQITYSLNFKK